MPAARSIIVTHKFNIFISHNFWLLDCLSMHNLKTIFACINSICTYKYDRSIMAYVTEFAKIDLAYTSNFVTFKSHSFTFEQTIKPKFFLVLVQL